MSAPGGTVVTMLLFALHLAAGALLVAMALAPASGGAGTVTLAPALGFWAVALGLWLRRRWARWPAIALVFLVTPVAFMLAVGNIVWPEGLVNGIIAGYAVFLVVEIATVVHAGRFGP